MKILQIRELLPKREQHTLASYLWFLINFAFKKLRGMMKFAIVGGTGALVGFTMIYTLTEFAHLHYLISAVIAAVSTTTMCYTLNHFWTFRRAKVRHGWLAGWVKYTVADEIFDAIFIGEMALFTEVFGLWYMASAVLAVFVNYPIRYFLFRRYVWAMPSLLKGQMNGYKN